MQRQETVRDDYDDDDAWSTSGEDAISDDELSQLTSNNAFWSGATKDPNDDSSDSESEGGLSFGAHLRRQQPGAPFKGKKHCLYLRQGVGGIYTFPMTLPDEQNKRPRRITAISTTGCLTCVGIYIPIDDNRCFAAHIDGSVFQPLENRNINAWQMPYLLAVSFRGTIRKSLNQTFQGMQEEVENIRKRPDLKARAIIVCTWPVVGQQKATGWHIIDIICDYFQLDKDKVVRKYAAHHGFIVNHFDANPQNIKLMGWTRPGPTEQVLDGIAKIADGCVKTWGENFRGVFQTTYHYVLPQTLGWETRLLEYEDEKTPWIFEYDGSKNVWTVG